MDRIAKFVLNNGGSEGSEDGHGAILGGRMKCPFYGACSLCRRTLTPGNPKEARNLDGSVVSG